MRAATIEEMIQRVRRGPQFRAAAVMVLLTGLVILGYVGWDLYGTGYYQRAAQAQLQEQLAARNDNPSFVFEGGASAPAPSTVATSATSMPATAAEPATPVPAPGPALHSEVAPADGSALGRIVIPKVGLDTVMVQGVGVADLKKGPGHMPWTPLPGQPGNAVVIGHRTTYGAPFYSINELAPGDHIIVETAIGKTIYAVRETTVVKPTYTWVTANRPGAWLTLTACEPRYSAEKRIIVFAEMVAGPNLAAVEALAPHTTAPAPAG